MKKTVYRSFIIINKVLGKQPVVNLGLLLNIKNYIIKLYCIYYILVKFCTFTVTYKIKIITYIK